MEQDYIKTQENINFCLSFFLELLTPKKPLGGMMKLGNSLQNKLQEGVKKLYNKTLKNTYREIIAK